MLKDLKLGERISLLRQTKKMTQKDLANKLNLSDKTISKWEIGENEPSIKDIQELTSIFEVSLELILNGNETNDKDKNAVASIVQMKAYNESAKIIDDFMKKECPYKDINKEDLFIILDDNKPYAMLDAILYLDDFDFYNKVNEKFEFVRAGITTNYNRSALDSANKKPQLQILKHPYTLELDDIVNCNSLEFYDEVIKTMEERYEKEVEHHEELTKIGYGYGSQPKNEITDKLSQLLENLPINEIDDDRVYEKILYLIDHGAVFYNRVPYDYSDGYELKVDRFRTDFTYKTCADHIRFINQIAELQETIEELKKNK